MYLKIYGPVEDGEVRWNPYSYEYSGVLEDVESYLSSSPQPVIPLGSPEMDDPKMGEPLDEEWSLRLIGTELMRRGVLDTEIIYE